MPIAWSILIAGVPSRFRQAAVVDSLISQAAGHPEVEVLYLLDNKRRSVGAKRNALLAASVGDYISFVDDDDEVAGNYVETILAELAGFRGDVLTFRQMCRHLHTGYEERCEYGLDLDYLSGRDGAPKNSGWWQGKPAHTMVWKGSIARSCRFPDGNFGEDVGWVARACQIARTETALPDVLYTYRFNPATSETRG